MLDIFTPHGINIYMSVVKKDKVVHGMLQDELERCEGLAVSLEAAISELPKGSLHERKMRHKKKEFVYNYLKFREGSKSVYKHVPKGQAEKLAKLVKERQKKDKDLGQLKARIKYLEKLLKAGID